MSMSLSTTIGNLIKGVGSTLLRAGTLHQILSTAVADGIDSGIARATPALVKNCAVAAVLITGIFLLGVGMAKWAEAVVVDPGIGFMIIGVLFIGGAGLYWVGKK